MAAQIIKINECGEKFCWYFASRRVWLDLWIEIWDDVFFLFFLRKEKKCQLWKTASVCENVAKV